MPDKSTPDTRRIPKRECCICLSRDVTITDPFGYPFCAQHEYRAQFLAWGRAHNWPDLRIEGITGTYAIEGDVSAYLLTVFCGTDERIAELMDALYELDQAQEKAS